MSVLRHERGLRSHNLDYVHFGMIQAPAQKRLVLLSASEPTPQACAFLEANGVDSTGFFGFNKTLRYTEGVLEDGELVAVYGIGKWEADPEPGKVGDGYRDKPMRLRMVSPHDGPMLVSDDPEATA